MLGAGFQPYKIFVLFKIVLNMRNYYLYINRTKDQYGFLGIKTKITDRHIKESFCIAICHG